MQITLSLAELVGLVLTSLFAVVRGLGSEALDSYVGPALLVVIVFFLGARYGDKVFPDSWLK